jgi:hypothetical protein
MAVLTLGGGRVLWILGWGRHVRDRVPVRAEFNDDGTFRLINEAAVLFGRTLAAAPADWLMIDAKTTMVQSGGGWIGWGFGITGPLRGAAKAKVLNRLTTRHTEYALLALLADLPDGSRRELVVGYRKLTESRLRAMLAESLPGMDGVVRASDARRARARPGECGGGEAPAGVVGRGRRAPAVVGRADHPAAGRVHGEPSIEPAGSPRPQLPAAPDPAMELRKLAYLRATGALSEDEFEKRRSELEAR